MARKWTAAILIVAWLCSAGLAALAGRIEKIIASQPGGNYAINVVYPKSGATIYGYNAKKSLLPASNMKLITTAAALKYLGPDFEYKTTVSLCGDTLVIVGSGDPLLGDKDTDSKHDRQPGWMFEEITAVLRAQNIGEINDIIVDTSVFDNQKVHPNWPAKDYNKWYACEVCGLNYNGNCIEVTTTNRDGAVAIDIDPPTRFVEIVNNVEAISKGDEAVGAYRTQQPNKIIVFGKCRTRQGPFRVAIENASTFFGFLLAEHLGRSGITAKGKLVETTSIGDCDPKLLVTFTTAIADVLGRANTDSLGLAAEALLKTVSAQHNPDGRGGSWEGGRELLCRYLTDLGVSDEEFNIDDGSGLSRENRLTTNAIVKVLLDVYRGTNWALFEDSLAVGGEEGTIDRYFSDMKYRGNVIGKTGYISGVRAFSGLCKTRNGPYIFSVLSNGSKGLSRDAINDVAKAIIDEYGPPAE
jgi:D-alanyl-D-alanine carboxypeptidase/D-alanyl-D-alanine-endopeptidase (penicillin-binding protein 4)